jgi:pilus assembly protein CpaF
METLVLMAGFDLPVRAIREQINSAIDLILQVDRMPDGRRVVTSLTEVQGMEGETILLQDIFKYRFLPGTERGKPSGELVPTGLRPKFMDKLNERDIEVPAHAFKAPVQVARPTAPVRSRRQIRVPEASEIADRERLR